MNRETPKAWLCEHCGERVDPTMAFCWSCGRGRDGERLPGFEDTDDKPFTRCPQCDYDLRGNLEAEVCAECGSSLVVDGVQKKLYWVPSTTKAGAIAKLFRNPLRMIPIAILCWLLFGMLYLADGQGRFFSQRFYARDTVDGFLLLFFVAAAFFTFAVIGGTLVQGLQPDDEEQAKPSFSRGGGIILPWLTRGWGKHLFWVAWLLLLLSYLLY